MNMVSGAGSIPVSVTPDGRIMERSEVVEYLKALSQHILIRMKLEEELEGLRSQLAEATKEEPEKQITVPEPDPPLKESYPILTLIVVPLGILFFLFSDYPAAQKAGGVAVITAALLFSLFRHRRANERAQREWEEQRAAWEKETERVRNLNSAVSTQDTPEVVSLKEQMGRTEDACERICTSMQGLEEQNVLAPGYREGVIPCVLYGFFLDGRANTLSEAINLFHEEMHRKNQEENQLRIQEEIRMHQDALMRQQNLNAARLSAQIEDAKNEIELQGMMNSLYTADMIRLLWKELR